jgi:hypothetical protein
MTHPCQIDPEGTDGKDWAKNLVARPFKIDLYWFTPKPRMGFALHRTVLEGTDGREETLGPADIGKEAA